MADSGRYFNVLTAAVAAGETVRDAAARHEISERQAYRIAGTDEFKARVAELRSAMLDCGVGVLSDSVVAASRKLRALVEGSDGKLALGASRAVLEHTQRFVESGEILRRLAALEELAQADQNATVHRHPIDAARSCPR